MGLESIPQVRGGKLVHSGLILFSVRHMSRATQTRGVPDTSTTSGHGCRPICRASQGYPTARHWLALETLRTNQFIGTLVSVFGCTSALTSAPPVHQVPLGSTMCVRRRLIVGGSKVMPLGTRYDASKAR